MISVIVVILVGIGFTRLTMLALEMQDEDDLFDSAPAETLLRKEIIVERMRAMKKPRALVITGEDQCKLPEADVIARQEERERENDIFASMYSATPRVKEDEPDEEKGSDLEEPVSAIENKLAPELAETEIDANDLCIICFERSKNAVYLDCGHGASCYSCAIDTCVVTGRCPLCRAHVQQIVIVEESGALSPDKHKSLDDAPRMVRVVGPT
uniref:RING-type domain-containing protein n=1 Tax=Florenciella parvula TaxID=236787 RepID=A0A7S2BH25_9STRA|mmetsp:Transcript_16438/g.34323  ORF Transcript_16438/g.34323 Transcript_16438/m.34323 type:complete len:212 (+) Transcript_16438:122-757(+)|eukprot:CAMPEP_0182546044 /NCGR_PEP_ID=MMETSP1323-20130603/35433_1 /TAXON_ID=236787 /ORGANISM="Florenciella parvula, Strain RCC1693" /LENGTH=211 /DNA_ID=CAMNT_0024757237 /DNA_START=111 /DNA_END=746 /DNA_ORIENTATION=+